MIETNEIETNGMRNDFKAAMDKTEQESVNEIMNSGLEVANVECEILDEAVDFKEILVGLFSRNKNWNLKFNFQFWIQELSKQPREKNNDCLLVLKYIKVNKTFYNLFCLFKHQNFQLLGISKLIVKKWGQELNYRAREDKLAVKGRIETALHSQTVTHLKPLCRKLKTKVSASIFSSKG